ncbi:DNA polymerase III subunit beta [Candidatus Saccharibacteria bacterium]|nr:DNA polymerase III subunit beta [Candidatus Saccharibacteria bacterium]MBP9985730.1 DNA polymerase III subunit beta [Candidatus Saccharibacteria bacterium]
MELTVTQENLSKALNAVGRVANGKTQLPILSNILLRTDGNRLLIAATNLEIAITEYIGAKITKPGAITIPAKLVAEFVGNLPNDTIEFKVVKDNLHIQSGSYKSIINGVIADEFPELPTINEDASVQYNISVNDFKQAVNQTIVATSNDMARPVLTGVFWHSVEGMLYLAGTDGYRLAERRLVKTKSQVSAIIPSSTLQEVLRVLSDDSENVDILFDEMQVRFRIDNTEIISNLIDGNYPDYRQLIPATSANSAIVKKSDFSRIVKISGLFSRDSGGSLNISLKDDAISIHSIASELGENTSKVEAAITGEGEITLNSRYLTEALNVIDCEEVSFGFDGKMSPSLIHAVGKDVDYYHIIMPLKS